MAKVIVSKLQIDDEVEGLVQRIGAIPSPRNYITGYDIRRDVNGPTVVTVSFIADEEFSKAQERKANG